MSPSRRRWVAFLASPVRRKARQAHAFLEARGGAQMRFAGDGPLVEGGAAPLLKQQQTGACKARPADEENNVAGLCLAAQERLFRLPEHSQAEVELVGAGEVAAHKRHGSLGRQLGHARAQAVHKAISALGGRTPTVNLSAAPRRRRDRSG